MTETTDARAALEQRAYLAYYGSKADTRRNTAMQSMADFAEAEVQQATEELVKALRMMICPHEEKLGGYSVYVECAKCGFKYDCRLETEDAALERHIRDVLQKYAPEANK